MTKVLDRLPGILLVGGLLSQGAFAQSASTPACPQTATALYSRLNSIGLDEHRVYRVRGATIDRPNLHIVLDSGTIAFTEDVCGHTIGALFEGEAEILLRPPNKVERQSLALFTGMAILEEQFSFAYFGFNDDTPDALRPFLSGAEDGAEFVKQRNESVRSLAEADALRFLLDFSHSLPTPTGTEALPQLPRLLHSRIQGNKLGMFEVFWDEAVYEPVWAGQVRMRDGVAFWDIWTSFAPNVLAAEKSNSREPQVAITSFRIRATVQPPTQLRARTEIELAVRKGGKRALSFELSRDLKIESVEEDGRPLEFIQNAALEGTELRRKGNDQVAVVFASALKTGQKVRLTFRYAGEVLSEAGQGLLYVGERGTWYPNLGFSPAQFDLEFEYPEGWTLVATGKQTSTPSASNTPGMQMSTWTSEAPTVVAGFNLGKYVRAEAKSGKVVVTAYGTKTVERSFPKAPPEVVQAPVIVPGPRHPFPLVLATPPPPSPARNVQIVADKAAQAIESFSKWFGPYPYSSLALTQMPGDLSQGWPGLVFLSSFAFLSPQEQADLHQSPVMTLLNSQVLAHETAHQWWGDLILWKSYRDQWFVEGLSNYSALLVLEKQNPAAFRQVLEKYRNDLLSKNKDGEWLRDAGPVTSGQRLISSHFPGGYDAISYERGTWLFHMLRCMLRDAQSNSRSRNGVPLEEEPFFRGLRRIRERYSGKSLNTQELMHAFEEDLPRSLWYENQKSLTWFLDGWINGTAIPRLETRDLRFTDKERGTVVTGTLLQKDGPDELVTAVPVYGVGARNSMTFLGFVLADGSETSFHLNAPAGIKKIVLDPKQTILTTQK